MRTTSMMAVLTGLAATSAALAGDTVDFTMRAVAMTGDAAPGAPGAHFVGFGYPVINASGDVSFLATLGGPGVDQSNDSGIWMQRNGNVSLIAREGDAAPNLNGMEFGPFSEKPCALNDRGELAFGAGLRDVGSTEIGISSIWFASQGAMSLVAKVGDAAPGAPGATFGIIGSLALNNAGRIAFSGELTGGRPLPFPHHGMWSGPPDDLALVAGSGDAATGTQGVFSTIRTPFAGQQLDSRGASVFWSTVFDPITRDTNSSGVWQGGSGALELIVQEGDVAAGANGAMFEDVRDSLSGANGVVVFSGRIPSASGSFGSSNGVWRASESGLSSVILPGDPLPNDESGAVFLTASPRIVGAHGRGVYEAIVGESLAASQSGVFSDQSGEVRALYIEGETAPGINAFFAPADLLFDRMPAINSMGQAVIGPHLIGTEGSEIEGPSLWLSQPNEALQLIFHRGSVVEFLGATGRVERDVVDDIAFIFGSSHDNGVAGALNDQSEFTTCLTFMDGDEGVFALQLPAPCVYDFNADDVVDGADLQILLTNWGGDSAAVVGPIGGVELSELLATWGACE